MNLIDGNEGRLAVKWMLVVLSKIFAQLASHLAEMSMPTCLGSKCCGAFVDTMGTTLSRWRTTPRSLARFRPSIDSHLGKDIPAEIRKALCKNRWRRYIFEASPKPGPAYGYLSDNPFQPYWCGKGW